MNGRGLYLLFQRAMAHQGIEIDAWEDIDAADRYAWDDVADQVIFPEEAP
jgi:hypothetical protein